MVLCDTLILCSHGMESTYVHTGGQQGQEFHGSLLRIMQFVHMDNYSTPAVWVENYRTLQVATCSVQTVGHTSAESHDLLYEYGFHHYLCGGDATK